MYSKEDGATRLVFLPADEVDDCEHKYKDNESDGQSFEGIYSGKNSATPPTHTAAGFAVGSGPARAREANGRAARGRNNAARLSAFPAGSCNPMYQTWVELIEHEQSAS